MRYRCTAYAVLYLGLAAQWALGQPLSTPLTVDEGRELAEKATGFDLSHSRADTEDYRGRLSARYTTHEAGEPQVSCAVDLTYGHFVSYSVEIPREGEDVRIPRDRAIAIAKEEGRRFLPEWVDQMEWKVTRIPTVEPLILEGALPPAGDPPRQGIRPSCSVYLTAHTGKVYDYFQVLPTETDPIPPKLTQEEALAKAAATLGADVGSLKVLDQPYLWQRFGEVHWVLHFRGPTQATDGRRPRMAEDEYNYHINAVTGELALAAGTKSAGAGPPPGDAAVGMSPGATVGAEPPGHRAATTAAERATDGLAARAHAVLWLGGGVAVLACGAAGLVVARRRRATRLKPPVG